LDYELTDGVFSDCDLVDGVASSKADGLCDQLWVKQNLKKSHTLILYACLSVLLLLERTRFFHAGPSQHMHWITTAGNGSITASLFNVDDDADAMNGKCSHV
jgi:hypothetical protein